jgi:hypothetical protein
MDLTSGNSFRSKVPIEFLKKKYNVTGLSAIIFAFNRTQQDAFPINIL